MRIICRHHDKAPTTVEGVQALRIEIGGVEYEIRPQNGMPDPGALTLRLEHPISEALGVIPGANNMLHFAARKL